MRTKILVLGSSGRLGQALKHVVSVRQITDLEIVFSDRGSVDLLDEEATKNYFLAYRPDVVLNLAAQVRPRLDLGAGEDNIFASNLRLFQNVYAASLSAGSHNVIQASSYHMFSPKILPPYPSHSPPGIAGLNFLSPYAAAKSVELLMSLVPKSTSQDQSLNLHIVAMPNLFGPFGPASIASEHFVGATIRRMLEAAHQNVEVLEAYGNQQQKREYLFTLDAAEQLVKYLTYPSGHEPYSVISSGIHLTQQECWNLIAEATGYTGRTLVNPGSGSPCDMYFEEATIEPTGFQDALMTTVSWYAEQNAKVREHG